MPEAVDREIRRLRSLFWSDRDPDGRGFAPLADVYRRAGDYEEALELVTEGVDRLPTFATGHVVAGWVHKERGEADDQAESAFRRALELDPENVSALRGLGFLLADSGRRDEAREIFEVLSDLEPGDLEVRARLVELDRAEEGGATGSPEPALDAMTEPMDSPEEAVETAADLDDMVWEPVETGEEAAPAVPMDEETLEAEADGAPTTERVGESGPAAEELDSSAFGVSDRGEREFQEYVEGGEEMGTVEADLAELEVGEEAGEEPEEVMALADLAPEEPAEEPEEAAAVEDEMAMDLADLAPDVETELEVEEEPEEVMALADLAPEEPEEPGEEPEEVMALADLAPEEPEEPEEPAEEPGEAAAVEDEMAMDLAELAPDVETELEPEEEPEEVMALADLAPEEPEEPEEPAEEPGEAAAVEDEMAMDLAELAPEEPEALEIDEAPEPAMEVSEPVAAKPEEEAPEAAMDLADLAPEEPETAVEPSEPGGPRTRTMAELYVRQGLVDRAIDIYESLVEQRPHDEELTGRLDELRRQLEEEEPSETLAREMTERPEAGVEVETPFAWTQEEEAAGVPGVEGAEEERPVKDYFRTLLGGEESEGGEPSPEEAAAVGDEPDAAGDADDSSDSDESEDSGDSDHDDFTEWMNEYS